MFIVGLLDVANGYTSKYISTIQGLDSAIAFQTMQLLKNLANHGKTVVASLHQPSSEIFGLLDRVIILAKGRVVYNGYVHDLAGYLQDYTGYECPQYSNIADFVLQQVIIISFVFLHAQVACMHILLYVMLVLTTFSILNL